MVEPIIKYKPLSGKALKQFIKEQKKQARQFKKACKKVGLKCLL